MSNARDIHSFSEPEKVRITHCSLDLDVSFEKRRLSGTARLSFDRIDPSAPLVLDTRDLEIERITGGETGLDFEIGSRDLILGSPLRVHITPAIDSVLIRYSTLPTASGLQWLTPEQTADKVHPFLFSQNQSIHARSWIPIQDSPGVRITYDARIRVPQGLTAIMSASRKALGGDTHEFVMNLPVTPYLIALAVGDLAFMEIGPRTGVFAERSLIASAAREFEDSERLLEAVERLYGPYRWGRYDLLVLPPSFPFGGMENPMVTFATPTIIAGDKSLIGLVSHELAHSWSGNLVTNATWSDFWLNEGFTTYIENRIQEEVYGREQALMEQVLDRRELENELREFDEREQVLHIDLHGRDPDDGTTRVPYIKGALFLRQLEETFGRQAFDQFLKDYFAEFAFRSIDTEEALTYIRQKLLERFANSASRISLDEWVYQPGLPEDAPFARSERLERVAEAAANWISKKITAASLPVAHWNSQEWIEFLQVLPRPLEKTRLAELDTAFHLTGSENCEILQEWLVMAIESEYESAYRRLEQFLLDVGRMRYLKPLYRGLMKTENGKKRAREIYNNARPAYHPIAQMAIDKIFGS